MKISVSLAISVGDNFPVVVLDNAKYAQLEPTGMYAVYNDAGQKVFEAPKEWVLYVTYLQDTTRQNDSGLPTGVTPEMVAEASRENDPNLLPAMPAGMSFSPPPPEVPPDSLVKPDVIPDEEVGEKLENGPLA